jgi:zinc protease
MRLILVLCFTFFTLFVSSAITQAQEQAQEQAQDKRAQYETLLQQLAAEHEPFYNAQTTTLDNGLQIVVVPNDRAPILTHMIWYKVGAADEPMGGSGIAHFLEHLMFKGSTNVPSGTFSERVRQMGGFDNAFTSWDYTAYFQTIPSEHLEEVMRMESDRMRGAKPSEADFLSERDVVIEERRQTLDNNPGARLNEQVRHALYVNHPYGRPIIGWMDEMEVMDWKTIKAFYNTYYAPNNAILVVAGDATLDQVTALARKYYGVIPSANIPQRARPAVPTFDAQKRLVMQHPLVKQRGFYRSALIDDGRDDPMGALALSVATMIMDGGMTSRLYKRLVVEEKLAIGLSLNVARHGMDYGSIGYSATPTEGTSFEVLDQAIKAEIQKAAKEGFTQEELERAKSRIEDSLIFSLDSVTGPAQSFGRLLVSGRNIEEVEYFTHLLRRVTLDDVNAQAAQYFDTQAEPWTQSVYGYLLPEEAKGVIVTAEQEIQKDQDEEKGAAQ